MGEGIRAEIKVDAAGSCPVTEAARAADSSTFSISRGVDPGGAGGVTEEFMLDADPDDAGLTAGADLEEVFAYGDRSVYRFERDQGWGCPCEAVERFDCPVVDVHTRDGMLYLVFHAADMEQLRGVIDTLQEEYPRVDIQRLLRSTDDAADHNLVFVDRGKLTDRQREVLETAHEMGYFDYPKGANATEVANELGISPSTLSEHLAAAQSKLLDAVLEA